jgi:hypothetical protein
MGKARDNSLFGNYVPVPPIGAVGQALVVNSGGDGLLYANVSGSGGGGGLVSQQELTASQDQTVFNLSPTLSSVDNSFVFRLGHLLDSSEYTLTTSQLTLNNGADAGDPIAVLEYGAAGSGSGATTFVGLTDTPSSLSGQGNKFVAVNSGGSALEFVNAPSGGGSGSNNTSDISQASNGYSVGEWIYVSGSSTALANATSSVTSEPVFGVVTTAGDPTFTVTTEGEATLTGHGFTVGSVLYLDEVAGQATVTASLGGIYKQLGFVVDANTIHVRIGDTIELGGNDTLRTYQEFSFLADSASVNYDLPIDVANAETLLLTLGGVPQPASAYNIIGDGDGNPRRVQLSDYPPHDAEMWVRYLGVIEEVSVVTPVASTDYNSGVPVPLALSSTTDSLNIQAGANFIFAHGLGVKPKDINIVLRCLSADSDYSVGDEVPLSSVNYGGSGVGEVCATVAADTSNITVRFRKSSTIPYTIVNDAGSIPNIDLGNWGVVVYANEEMGGTNGVISAVNTPATEFESNVVPLALSATTDTSNIQGNDNFKFAHGLGQKPKSARVVLVCLQTDASYAVGDELEYGSSSNDEVQLVSDSTHVQALFLHNVSSLNLTPKTDSDTNYATMNLERWGIKVYANSELGGYKGDRGPAGTGKIAQVKYDQLIGPSSGTGIIPMDSTIPQNTEGDQIMEVQITPKNPDSTLIIEANVNSDVAVGQAIFKDSEADALAAIRNDGSMETFKIYEQANGTSTRTYKLRVGRTSGTYYINDGTGTNGLGGVIRSTFSVTEILP